MARAVRPRAGGEGVHWAADSAKMNGYGFATVPADSPGSKEVATIAAFEQGIGQERVP